MLTRINSIIGVAGAVAVVAASVMFFKIGDEHDAAMYAHIAPPAKDALVQAVDLTRISHFRYLNEHTLEVTDDTGKNFKMELTEDCPGLKDASDFSLVTEDYRNFDRFTAIGVKGSICTFKDFSPMTADASSTSTPPPSPASQ